MGFDLVLFGGTGDLAWRKLMPALFQAFRHGTLPAGGRIIGVGRDPLSHDQYRELIRARFEKVELAKRPSAQEFAQFADILEFVRMDLSKPDDYATLAASLRARNADTVVMYVATAPSLFTTVCEQLAAAGLNTPQTRVVLEKPLGNDLASNRSINHTVRRFFDEKQVFRIDHYLGKPAVQNLFALRFGNALFEPLWRREHIANIQITIAEDLGVESRGAFYENTGALRDMVQNHALQLLCAIGMEPPINAHADAIRDEKLKVLRSLKPWTQETLAHDVIRGQYAAGAIGGTKVPGYREEPGVHASSQTETFVALRTEIANWRWAGVPFYIRTGKRLASRDARIVVNFRPTPHAIFPAPTSAWRTAWLSTCNPKTAWSCTCLPKARPTGNSGAIAGPGAARPRLRQTVWHRAGGRVRAATARCDRRAAQPVCAQRRARGGLALGRTGTELLGQRCQQARARMPRAPGGPAPPAP